MKFPYLLFVVLFFTVLSACKKDAVDVNADMEGKWCTQAWGATTGSMVTIDAGGQGMYDVRPCCGAGTEQHYDGKAKIKDKKLIIGGSGKKATLNVNEFPGYDADGNYRMILSGLSYYAAVVPANPVAIVSGTIVTFSWDIPANFDSGIDQSKSLDYRIASTGTWTTVEIHDNSNHPAYSISGLAPATTYEWRIKSITGKHSSQYSAINSFTTQ